MRNYFNYFTEIEEYFFRKRGRNLLAPPLDWCLIELWKESKIPLHVVLRGIDRSFESALQKNKKPPRSLAYCHAAVVEAFEEYARASLGESREEDRGARSPSGPEERRAVEGFLQDLEISLGRFSGDAIEQARRRLSALRFEVTTVGVRDPEELDAELRRIGERVAEFLRRQLEPEDRKELSEQARQELRIYKKRVSAEMFESLEKGYLDRKVLELHQLQEFTLLNLSASFHRYS